jgi:hypothetical protein
MGHAFFNPKRHGPRSEPTVTGAPARPPRDRHSYRLRYRQDRGVRPVPQNRLSAYAWIGRPAQGAAKE